MESPPDALEELVSVLSDVQHFSDGGADFDSAEGFYRSVVKNACRLLQTPAGTFFVFHPGSHGLNLAASWGLPDVTGPVSLREGEGIVGRAAKEGEPFFIEDLRADRRFLRDPQPPFEAFSMASVPLRSGERLLGVLSVHWPSARPIDDKDKRLLNVLAHQAALLMENYSISENLRRFSQEMIQTLMEVLDAKDAGLRRRANHIRRFARGVARKLQLPEELERHIEYAVLVRDIGRVGIGDDILRKPSRLTREEYRLVKTHPEIGSRILSPATFLAPVLPIVHYHREWYNGQGYPEGLSGEEIPLGARIVAVISAWDAMTSERTWRRTLSRDEAAAELSRGAGTQFDPKVVGAFLQVLNETGTGAPEADGCPAETPGEN